MEMAEKRFIYKSKNGTMVIIDKKNNVLIRDKYRACDLLNTLADENEQLKQRNKNQYEQLIQLWKLIENEDYNTLRSMLNQLEEDEKQLRKEWGTYSD